MPRDAGTEVRTEARMIVTLGDIEIAVVGSGHVALFALDAAGARRGSGVRMTHARAVGVAAGLLTAAAALTRGPTP